ncbi:calpain-3 [Lampris incognitus]|uniref:calpain-3 n=1 Tax=Lampris incognitus TaxID=2546036 RepID=UPI0024B4C64B|nr:calpain-3 [Lampris incognitus]
MSVSSEDSIPPAGDVADSGGSPTDELMGSHSRRWLSSILPSGMLDRVGDVRHLVGRDGLFVDRDFPVWQLELQAGVRWKRPQDICSSPQFIVDGASRMDVNQGLLNDCWFLSAVASLSMCRPLLEKVVPAGQSFQDGYNGSFHFRFWQYGQWEEVIIDDLLPTREGRLIYLSSPEQQEFWSSLLEKAYAKLKGGYMTLDMGFPHEAMVDMTGGVTEVLTVASLPRDVPTFLRHLLAKGSLINCANCQGPINQKNKMGIVFRHAYSLTGAEKVRTKYGTVDLVRINNPWGNTEWEGPWSDHDSPEWDKVSPAEQQRLDRVSREDGEFWMSVSDFRQNFETLEMCHLSDTLSLPGHSVRPWHCTMHHGNWVSRMSAGGPPSGKWFMQNPQFNLTLLEEDDDPLDPKETCTFVVALMQKHQRRTGVNLAIGLHIYKAHSQGKYLPSVDLSLLQPVLKSAGYTQRREVVLRGRLAPGHYIIVASTSAPNEEGAFLLRVLTEKGNAATPAKPATQDISTITQASFLHPAALPSPQSIRRLFKKHCNKKGTCKPLELHSLLTEAIQGGVLAGSEKNLALEHCKSLVVLMDKQGRAQLDWQEFQNLWNKIREWTDIFLTFDRDRSRRLEYLEVKPALKAAGIAVDDFVMELIGLRYTEPDMTISYPGFLYLLMKLDSMIYKFQAYDVAGLGTISLSYRQWLHMTMYN